MLFFADPGEGPFVQATMMGGVVILVTSLLLVLWFLDNPYRGGVGAPQAHRDGEHAESDGPRDEHLRTGQTAMRWNGTR